MDVGKNYSILLILVCADPLGMEDGRIEDSQITASSQHSISVAPKYARLNHITSEGGWAVSHSDSDRWIQVNFNVPRMISGIILQGKLAHDQWVTKYTVAYSNDGASSTYVADVDSGVDMVRFT